MNVRLAVAAAARPGSPRAGTSRTPAPSRRSSRRSYGVGLATVGLFTTALFITHLLLQVPAGKASDRYGERRVALAGLVIIVCFNAVALIAPVTALAIAARTLIGVGTGLAFVSGSAYVRVQGGSPFAQGLFGGVALGGGGLALAIVPPVEDAIGWRAPYVTAIVVGAAGLVVLRSGPRDVPRSRTARPSTRRPACSATGGSTGSPCSTPPRSGSAS